jgi:hypothetical protein
METAHWRLGTKIAFRFVFTYFLLYTLNVLLRLVPHSSFAANSRQVQLALERGRTLGKQRGVESAT